MNEITEIRKKAQEVLLSFAKIYTELGDEISKSIRKISESIDWDYLEELKNSEEENVIKMSKNGWTLSPNFGLDYHMVVKELNGFEEINQAFIDLYYDEEYTVLNEDIDYIRKNINKKHIKLFDQCVENYEQGNYAIVIPSLLSMLEGTCAEIINSTKVGKELVGQFKHTLKNEKFVVENAKLSLYILLKKYIFVSKDFNKKRPKGLNRNWVLHGRDDARLWEKADALKLINNLATALFVKESYLS